MSQHSVIHHSGVHMPGNDMPGNDMPGNDIPGNDSPFTPLGSTRSTTFPNPDQWATSNSNNPYLLNAFATFLSRYGHLYACDNVTSSGSPNGATPFSNLQLEYPMPQFAGSHVQHDSETNSDIEHMRTQESQKGLASSWGWTKKARTTIQSEGRGQ